MFSIVRWGIFITFFLAIPLFGLPLLGRIVISPGDAWESQIYWMRFHRTFLAILAGGGLSLAGMVFQALFRNPLATPYTLGIASGAAFGAAVYLQMLGPLTVWLGMTTNDAVCLGLPGVSWGAFGGALLAMFIVFSLAHAKDASSEQMLLAGVAVNFFFSSLILLLQYVSAPHDTLQMLRWTMGGVQNATSDDLWRLGPIVLVALSILIWFSRELNVVVTGRERAISLGVNVSRLRTILFIMVSLLVGAIVATTGPIGFVGLMIPHIARMLVGPDHRRLVPASLLLGAIFLPSCDTLGRTLLYPAELPVGIITSLLGGPFFLWLLLRSERRLN